jgi:hypothetical protein
MRVVPTHVALLVVLLACTASACQSRPSTSLRGPLSVVELDHVYLYAPERSTEAAVVAALTQAGLRVTAQRNEFPDGVVGRYVRFDNAYLEVLWYDGVASTDADTRRRARWETTGASPFGIGLHRVNGAPEELPFATRGYTPPWYERGTEMRFLGTEADTQAPSLFVVPKERANLDTVTLERQLATAPSEELRRRLSNRVHALGIHRVTAVRVVIRGFDVSEAARLLTESGIVQIAGGNESLLVLGFDNAQRRESKDLRPVLPLVLNY